MSIIYKVQQPEVIVIEGNEVHNDQIVPKKIFFIRINSYLGYLFLENGECLKLTPMRLRVVEQLVNAVKNGISYIPGKTLLENAGSEQFYVGHLFWTSPNWKNFIENTKQGLYRLKIHADTTLENYNLNDLSPDIPIKTTK